MRRIWSGGRQLRRRPRDRSVRPAGYVRDDYKTATTLLAVNRALLDDYGGDLNALHAVAADPDDLERRIIALGQGIGAVKAAIFLRELRGRWSEADPPLSPPALRAAQVLGFLPDAIDAGTGLVRLRHLWRSQGTPPETFADFEAALVREGLRLRRGAAP